MSSAPSLRGGGDAVRQQPSAADCPLTRRGALSLLGGTLAAAATGCRTAPTASLPRAQVTIARAPAYGPELYDIIRRVIGDYKLDIRGKRVVLKPNLVEFEEDTCINTNPLVVHAALEGFRAAGAADVRIAEGPGHRRITLDLADAAGYFSIIPKFEDIFVDLNLDDVTERRIPSPFSKIGSLYLPNTALGADLLVSLPKMKTHHWVGATLSMKNLFGLVPGAVYGWPKNVLHWAGIDACVADIHKLTPKTFAIVDGVVGMEGNGPIQGTPKEAGVIIAGSDLAAVDATCCRVMGFNPAKVQYLSLVGIPDVSMTGETIETARTTFSPAPGFERLRA